MHPDPVQKSARCLLVSQSLQLVPCEVIDLSTVQPATCIMDHEPLHSLICSIICMNECTSHIHNHTLTDTYAQHIRTYTNTHTMFALHTLNTHAQTHTHIHTYIQTHIHTHPPTQTTHTHTHSHTLTHTDAHILVSWCSADAAQDAPSSAATRHAALTQQRNRKPPSSKATKSSKLSVLLDVPLLSVLTYADMPGDEMLEELANPNR
jgi:hypothetical protein